jgi:transcription elongation factor Elf1
MAKKQKPKAFKYKYRYICPACTFDAILTSTKELGTIVICTHCQKQIKLDNPNNFILL